MRTSINLLTSILYATSVLLISGNGNSQNSFRDKLASSTHDNNAFLATSSVYANLSVTQANATSKAFSPQPQLPQSKHHQHSHKGAQHTALPSSAPALLSKMSSSPGKNKPHPHEEHEKAAASTIFRNLLLKSFSNSNRSNNNLASPELTFHDGQTIATIHTNLTTNEVYCNLIEVNTPEESDRVLQKFAEQNRRVQKTNFRTILAVITACQALDSGEKGVKRRKSNSSFFPSFLLTPTPRDNSMDLTDSTETLPLVSQNNPSDMWTVISGILPGTKWCGLGDIAKDYGDLGAERMLDKCCRAHDHCPTKLKALRSGYGLVNWSFYTKSHCDCDSLLFDCLKKAGNPTADMLGNFYFNILRVQCIDEEEAMKCALYDDVTNQCKLWKPDHERASKRMFFRNIRREF